MIIHFLTFVFGLIAILIGLSGTAQADKKSGTLNIALQEQYEGIRPTFGTPGEALFYQRAVYDNLIDWDLDKKEFIPNLATSWKRINKTTLEFKLRKDVKFHDGSIFDADDVVYTFNWVSNPKLRVRSKARFTWIKEAVKIDAHTVHIISKKPFVRDLSQIQVHPMIFPSDLHGSLVDCNMASGGKGKRGKKGKGAKGEKGKGKKGGKGKAKVKDSPKIAKARREGKCKSDYGRNYAIGTGAYRMVKANQRHLILEATDNYPQANVRKPVPSIKRVKFWFIDDAQTRFAHLMTGDVDITQLFKKGSEELIQSDPRFDVTFVKTVHYSWMNLDSTGRTGQTMLKDVRVRRAISHAINREELLKKVILGGENQKNIIALCSPLQTMCDTSIPLPEYNPEKAQQLLAEAGYPNGFKIKIATISAAKNIAEVVAGYLRKVGIKAKIATYPFGVMRRMNRQKKNPIIVSLYGSGGQPDAGTPFWFHFIKSSRQWNQDKILMKMAKVNDTILDPVKRANAIREGFGRNNRQSFVIPLAVAPRVLAHTKDLVLPNVAASAFGTVLHQLKWK